MTMSTRNFNLKGPYLGFFILLIFLFNSSGILAANITLSWIPPTKKADGSPLTDLAGYKVYSGLSSRNYIRNNDTGNVTSYTVTDLSADTTYYFTVTAYDSSGNESGFSNEISVMVDAVPYYCDKDNDGYINSSTNGSCAGAGCEPSGCQTTAGNDCDDSNDSINPGRSDTNCNGTDDNCNGQVDEGFVPATTTCGVGSCASTGILQCTNGQIVDTCLPYSPKVEVCDGSDNNCDGQIDEVCTPAISVGKVLLSEDFSGGIPDTWGKTGNWNTENYCGKNIDSPFVEPYALADSSCTFTGTDELITPALDTSFCNSVELAFSNQLHIVNGDVEINISGDGGSSWIDTINMPLRDGYPVPNWKSIDISAITDANDARIKFSYASKTADGFWALDNIWATCHPDQLMFEGEVQSPSQVQTILIANTGNDNLTINGVGIKGADAADFLMASGHNTCSGRTLLPSESCTLDVLFLPASGGTKIADLTILSNDPFRPVWSVPLAGTVTDVDPVTVIKANGSTGSVDVRRGKRVTVTFELDPVCHLFRYADWWVLKEYNNKWKYYSARTRKWRDGTSFYDQAPLVEKGPVKVFNSSKMSTGQYNFYFGIDTNMNGIQDPNEYYFDKVTVNVR